MKNVVIKLYRIAGYFFLAVLLVFLILYLRWFYLIPCLPLMAFNFILLLVYGVFTGVYWIAVAKDKAFIVKTVLFMLCIGLLGTVYLDLNLHMPRIRNTAKCNGNTYYITDIQPLFDEQWTETHLTKWRSICCFGTRFFGYSAGPFEIVCDEDNKETNFVNTYSGKLYYTDGDEVRVYQEYVGTKLENHRYFLSRRLFLPEGSDKQRHPLYDVHTYTLYECNLDYTNCTSLPIEYTSGDIGSLVLEADELGKEINLFDEYVLSERKILIFTYGENSRCYVDGCVILDE